jgi:hypothetical protein
MGANRNPEGRPPSRLKPQARKSRFPNPPAEPPSREKLYPHHSVGPQVSSNSSYIVLMCGYVWIEVFFAYDPLEFVNAYSPYSTIRFDLFKKP